MDHSPRNPNNSTVPYRPTRLARLDFRTSGEKAQRLSFLRKEVLLDNDLLNCILDQCAHEFHQLKLFCALSPRRVQVRPHVFANKYIETLALGAVARYGEYRADWRDTNLNDLPLDTYGLQCADLSTLQATIEDSLQEAFGGTVMGLIKGLLKYKASGDWDNLLRCAEHFRLLLYDPRSTWARKARATSVRLIEHEKAGRRGNQLSPSSPTPSLC